MKPTKIVIGVGEIETARELGEFVARLDFPGAELEFFHVVLPLAVLAGDSAADVLAIPTLRKAEEAEMAAARQALDKVVDEFISRGISAKGRVVLGVPSIELLRCAEELKADVVVVGWHERSGVHRYLPGSVSRAMIVGARTSVLVVKPRVGESPRRISAVLATDHSPYSKRCMERFAELSPRGIAELTVLSIYPELNVARLRSVLSDASCEVEECLQRELERKTTQLAEELRQIVPLNSATVVVGDPERAVHEAIEAADSQLLIVGAQGHNWIDRITLGSFSYHAVCAESCSVLIVRV